MLAPPPLCPRTRVVLLPALGDEHSRGGAWGLSAWGGLGWRNGGTLREGRELQRGSGVGESGRVGSGRVGEETAFVCDRTSDPKRAWRGLPFGAMGDPALARLGEGGPAAPREEGEGLQTRGGAKEVESGADCATRVRRVEVLM